MKNSSDEPGSVIEMVNMELNFLNTILDTAGSLILLLNKEGHIIKFNKACEKTTGFKKEEVQEKPFWDYFLLEEEIEPVKQVFFNLRAGMFPLKFENYWKTKTGDLVFISWDNSAMLDKNGNVEYILATGIDITYRLEAEALLKQNEERLRLASKASKIGIWEWNIKTNDLVWSDEVKEIFGHEDTTFIRYIDSIHPEDKRTVQDKLSTVLESKEDSYYEVEHRIINKSGKTDWVIGVGKVYKDKSGQSYKMVGTVQKITDRKELEINLKLSEEKFKIIGEISNDAIWEWDISSDELIWAKGLKPNNNLVITFPTRQALYECVHKDERKWLKTKLEEALTNKNIFDWEESYRLVIGNTALHITEKAKIIRDENGNALKLLGGLQDITQMIEDQSKISLALAQERKLNEELAAREEELASKEEELRQSFEELNSTHEMLEDAYDKLSEKERQMAAILENTTDIILSVDKDLNVTFANKAFINTYERYTGTKFPKYPNILDVIIPEKKEWYQSVYKRTLLGEVQYHITETHDPVYGHFYSEEFYNPIRNDKKQIKGFAVFIRDITERIVTEKKAKVQEQIYSSIIDSTVDLITALDLNFTYIGINKAAREHLVKLTGFDIEIGITNALKISDKKTCEKLERIKKIIEGSGTYIDEYFFKGSGELNPAYREDIYTPIKDENDNVTGLAVFSRDVTDHKLSESRIQKQTNQLIESNRKMAEYKLIALRSVMNPHFLFNSLNAIQYFITKNDRMQALNYLPRFSKLIRLVLNSSIENTNTLSEEIQILKIYIELESLRFLNKFTSDIYIDPAIKTENIEIPSLLLQPYVENAILHGLSHLEGNNGKLYVGFKKKENKLICTIEDNGIGRAAAKEIKKDNQLHKSVGMLVTQERIELINKNNAVSVEIKDLFDDRNKPSGTRVEIKFALN